MNKWLTLLIKKVFWCCTGVVCLYAEMNAQGESNSFGLQKINTKLAQHQSLFNHLNPAIIVDVQQPILALAIENLFRIQYLNRYHVGFQYPGFNGTLNLSYSSLTWTNNFYLRKYSFSFSRKAGSRLTLGTGINGVIAGIGSLGRISTFTVDVGGAWSISDKMVMGAFLNNPSPFVFKLNTESMVPAQLGVNMVLFPADKLYLELLLFKDLEFNPSLNLLVHYIFSEYSFIRAGVSGSPLSNYFGLGCQYQNWLVLFKSEFDSVLGVSSGISLFYYADGHVANN